jgi:hypothetical protein
VTFNDQLFAAWKGMKGDERIWWSTYNGANWAAQPVVPGVGTRTDLLAAAAAWPSASAGAVFRRDPTRGERFRSPPYLFRGLVCRLARAVRPGIEGAAGARVK